MVSVLASDLRPGDIIAVNGHSVSNVAIELVTSSPVSHVAIVADGTSCIEAQAFRTVGYADNDSYRNCSIILRCPDLSDVQRQDIVDFALSRFGVKYDYEAIVREFERYEFHVNIDPNESGTPRSHGRYICSTLVTAAYLSVGIRLSDVPLPSPDDIYASPRLPAIGRW